MDLNKENGTNAGNVFTDVVDETASYDTNDIQSNKIVCVLAYLGILFFLPLVACPQSRFGKFHANQALIALIFSAILNVAILILDAILGLIPVIGGVLILILGIVAWAVPLAVMVLGMVNAGNGTAKELPIIGKYKIIK